MIIKDRDPRENDIKELKRLLYYPDLTQRQRFLIEHELRAIEKGERSERDAAYYINFYYGDSKRWIVIHDLRIKFQGKVAQIDHILINRLFDIYILESKYYRYGVKITAHGEFEVYYQGKYMGVPSPIEQNKRHIVLLSELIRYYDLLPKRLSLPIKPRFFNYVLISPQCIIKRPSQNSFDTSNVIKVDSLNTIIEQNSEKISNIEAISSIVKMVSFSTIEQFGRELIKFHSPATIDWKKKFNIPEEAPQGRRGKYFCARCKRKISYKEAQFCWKNKKKFKGKAFCFKCQGEFRSGTQDISNKK